jgi:hypothetical protein
MFDSALQSRDINFTVLGLLHTGISMKPEGIDVYAAYEESWQQQPPVQQQGEEEETE